MSYGPPRALPAARGAWPEAQARQAPGAWPEAQARQAPGAWPEAQAPLARRVGQSIASSPTAGNLLSATTPADLARGLCRAALPVCPSAAHVSGMRVVAAAQVEPGAAGSPCTVGTLRSGSRPAAPANELVGRAFWRVLGSRASRRPRRATHTWLEFRCEGTSRRGVMGAVESESPEQTRADDGPLTPET
jgi:hypothetical protein